MCAALPYPPPEGRFPNSTCMSIEGQRDRQVQHPFLEVLVECRRCLILTVSGRVLAELSRTRKLSHRLAAPPLAVGGTLPIKCANGGMHKFHPHGRNEIALA